MTLFGVGTLIFLAVVCFVLMSMAITTYNGLVNLRFQVDRAWANIDVVLKQRFDLIPKLVSICEQFTQYERGTIDKIVNARKAYGSAQSVDDKIKSSAEMSQALRGIFAIGEAYPELKSSAQFVELQKALTSLESEIADRRELYNDAVTQFNTRSQQFPDAFFAQILGYRSVSLFHVDPAETVAPDIRMKLPA